MVPDEGIGGDGAFAEGGSLPCQDQVLQIDGAAEYALFVHHVQSGDIVIFLALSDQLFHGLFDGETAENGDVVGGHQASDFIVPVRGEKL